jgi:hypothetical protein
MDSNHRRPGVGRASSPLDHGTLSSRGGSRTHTRQALDLAALPGLRTRPGLSDRSLTVAALTVAEAGFEPAWGRLMRPCWCLTPVHSAVPPAGLEPAVNASTSGRCRRRWATGVAENQSGKRESNPPRRAHETLLEPLQSIPQSGRQESNLPQTAYQAVASPLSPRPELQRPVRESNPSFPVDSRGDAHQPLHRA